MRFLILVVIVFSATFAPAKTPAIVAKDLLDKIEFYYQNSDGTIELECKHWIGNFYSGDFEVACGKGTQLFKQYAAHVVVRSFSRGDQTTFEILYWITDKNVKGSVPSFSSHSQLFTVDRGTKIREFQMSQGIENDYAQLVLKYKP